MKNIIKNEQVNKIIKNRYFITTSLFFVWIMFIDHDNLVDRMKLYRQKKNLEQTKQYYKQVIEETRNEEKSLESKEYLEKIARESYKMKKDNEDIYIITD